MDLVQLFWTFITSAAPLVNYEGYDATGHVARRVQFTQCQTARFESVVKTNGMYVLQICESTNGVWETFGTTWIVVGLDKPGLAVTNIQTLSVPKKQPGQPRLFRLVERKP